MSEELKARKVAKEALEIRAADVYANLMHLGFADEAAIVRECIVKIEELERAAEQQEALRKDAERWQYWRQHWNALCRFEVASRAQIDLSRINVDSADKMDAVTDAAINQENQ